MEGATLLRLDEEQALTPDITFIILPMTILVLILPITLIGYRIRKN